MCQKLIFFGCLWGILARSILGHVAGIDRVVGPVLSLCWAYVRQDGRKWQECDRNMQGIERIMRKWKQNQEMKGEGKEMEGNESQLETRTGLIWSTWCAILVCKEVCKEMCKKLIVFGCLWGMLAGPILGHVAGIDGVVGPVLSLCWACVRQDGRKWQECDRNMQGIERIMRKWKQNLEMKGEGWRRKGHGRKWKLVGNHAPHNLVCHLSVQGNVQETHLFGCLWGMLAGPILGHVAGIDRVVGPVLSLCWACVGLMSGKMEENDRNVTGTCKELKG